jgi:hypothetical protein
VGKVQEARVQVGPWGCPEEQNWPFRGLWKHLALQIRKNPTDNCVQRWSRVYYRPGRKPVIEIPVDMSGAATDDHARSCKSPEGLCASTRAEVVEQYDSGC